MPKKLLIGLASVLALATFAMAPAVAQAMMFKVNGVKAGAKHENVTVFGQLTLKSEVAGEFKCKVVGGVPVWNEGGVGLNAVQGWEAFNCKYEGNLTHCKEPGQAFVTAETAVELITEEVGTEKHWKAKRGLRTTPWPGEPFETEKGKSLNMHKIVIYLDCPTEGFEVRYEGNLEPKWLNGSKNGLTPSHLVFEGKGGKTSWLGTCSFGAPCESEEHNLYVSGELTEVGQASEQLIQLE